MVSAHPSLTPPTALGSYGPPPGRAAQSVIPTSSASTSRLSFAAIGEVVKVSSKTVRRARGLFANVVAGHGVTLYDAGDLTAVQSFILSGDVQPLTPPLVTLQPASRTTTLRTTYLGVASRQRTGSEIWIWTELVENKKREASADQRRKTVATEQRIASLHALASGEVLVRDLEGRLSALSRTSDVTSSGSDPQILNPEEQDFRLTPLVASSGSPGATAADSSSSGRQVVHSLNVLDIAACSQIFAPGQVPSEDDAVAVVVAVTSAPQSTATSSEKKRNDAKSPKSKRKTAMEVIDSAEEPKLSRDGMNAQGPVVISVTTILAANSGDARLLHAGETVVASVQDASSLVDTNLYHDGKLSLLTRSGDLQMLQLSLGADGELASSPPRTLPLNYVAPIPAPSQPAAVLRLSASHFLVLIHAAGGTSKGKVAALIWDSELDALIMASDFSLPSLPGPSNDQRAITLTMSRVGGSQAIVNINQWSSETSLSVFWALPFYIPEGSVLRHAIGKGSLTSSWLRGGASSSLQAGENAPSVAQQSNLSPEAAALVEQLRQLASTGQRSAADKSSDMELAFASWVGKETDRLHSIWQEEQVQAAQDQAQAAAATLGDSDSDASGAEDAGVVGDSALAKRQNVNDKSPPKPHFSHSLVLEVLRLALPSTGAAKSNADGPICARKIVAYLLERRMVSCGMFADTEQGFIARLRSRKDWGLIMSSLRSVGDISEMDLVSLLQEVLLNEQSQQSQQADKAGIPSLAAFLSTFVSMAISRPLLRTTMHGRLTKVEDVTSMLDVMTEWLEERSREPIDFELLSLSDGATQGGSSGSRRGKGSRRKRLGNNTAIGAAGSSVKVPPTNDLVQFSMDVLDVFFPLLLNTPSSQRSLARLAKVLALHVSACDQLSTLRGPLQAFARFEADRARLAAEEERRQSERKAATTGGRRGMATSSVVTTATNGAGAEISAKAQTGGGMDVESSAVRQKKSARLQAFESSALVGPYTVEVLEI